MAHEVLVAVWRVRQPSELSTVELLPAVSYVACVTDDHVSNGLEYAVDTRQPSLESVVLLAPSYWACVTAVQLVLNEPLTRVRNPSDESTVVLVSSYVAWFIVGEEELHVGPSVPVTRTRHPSVLSGVELLAK